MDINLIYEIAKEKDCEIIDIYNDKDDKGKTRKYVKFICNKHQEKGEQDKKIEHFKTQKKPCGYCNHSKLKETFLDEMRIINPDIEILSSYVNWGTKIKCRCKKCNHKWEGRPSVLLYGGGCKKCGHKKIWDTRGRITTEEAKERIKKINPNIEVIGEYTGSHNYIKCKCLIHNIEWESVFCNLQNGDATCPKCSNEHAVLSYRLSNEKFKEILKENYPHIVPVDKYTTRETEIKFLCTNHNIEFYSKPRSFLYKKSRGCPLCQQSIGESKLLNLLNYGNNENIYTQYVFKDCIHEKPLRFDAYDAKNRIAYEYQGEQHFYPVTFNGIDKKKSEENYKLNQVRDNIKRDYCKNNNIKLIEIPYWEIDNMEKYINNNN